MQVIPCAVAHTNDKDKGYPLSPPLPPPTMAIQLTILSVVGVTMSTQLLITLHAYLRSLHAKKLYAY